VELGAGALAVADSVKGLQLVDIQDPSRPAWLFMGNDFVDSHGLEIVDGFAYLVTREDAIGSFQVYEVNHPATLLSKINLGNATFGFPDFKSGSKSLYLVSPEPYAVRIYSLQDPISPTLHATVPGLRRISVEGSRLYGIDETGFQIFDVSNLSRPILLGRHSQGEAYDRPNYLAVKDGIVYLSTSVRTNDGVREIIQVVDAHDPKKPRKIRDITGFSGELITAGNYLFVHYGPDTIMTFEQSYIFDISRPADPRLSAGLRTPVAFSDVEVSNDLVFIASGGAGVQIFRLHPEQFTKPFYLPLLTRENWLQNGLPTPLAAWGSSPCLSATLTRFSCP
jgi:hypothetical protein